MTREHEPPAGNCRAANLQEREVAHHVDAKDNEPEQKGAVQVRPQAEQARDCPVDPSLALPLPIQKLDEQGEHEQADHLRAETLEQRFLGQGGEKHGEDGLLPEGERDVSDAQIEDQQAGHGPREGETEEGDAIVEKVEEGVVEPGVIHPLVAQHRPGIDVVAKNLPVGDEVFAVPVMPAPVVVGIRSHEADQQAGIDQRGEEALSQRCSVAHPR